MIISRSSGLALALCAAAAGFLAPGRIEPPASAPPAAAVAVPQAPPAASTSTPAASPSPPAYDMFRIVPVRVHLLRDSETAAAVTHLSEKDVARIFRKANGIWHPAGIHLWVESVVSEKPASTMGFEHAGSLPSTALLALRPTETRQAAMFHVYYIGEMSPNGIFMHRDGIFVKESARLRPVQGGIDEPLPRVTAHELGHGMGLPHRQDTFNLLASGTTGTTLNEAEIAIVRATVEPLPWVLTPTRFLERAEQADRDKDAVTARSIYAALHGIPGDSPVKKRAAERSARD